MIQIGDEQSEQGYNSAVSALSIASESEMTRHDLEFMRHKLIAETCPDLGARLQIELSGVPPVQVALDRPYLLVGRDSDCDLHLDQSRVSPRHLYLQWIDGQLFCCDIGTSPGFFPGQEASSNGWWVSDGPIEIGPYRLTITHGATTRPAEMPLDRSDRLSSEYPLLALQFDGVAQSENVWPVNRVLTLIGRNATCKLRLNHKSVAPVQAALLRTSVGCWLIDLANNEGTRVNGRAVPFFSLDAGDELQLGDFYAQVGTMTIPANLRQERKASPSVADRRASIPLIPEPVVEHPVIGPGKSEFETSPPDVVRSRELKSSQAKPLPPIRMDRQPTGRPAAQQSLSAVYDPPVVELNSTGPSDLSSLEVPPSQASPSSARPAGSLQPRQNDQAIGDYVAKQQAELAKLKNELKRFKEIYDDVAGQLISRKLRDALEAPVIEILKQCDRFDLNLLSLKQFAEHRDD